MKNQKFLTKSRFKIGHECSRKLFYIEKKEYPNANVDNSFLEALAEGGFQVGALAKVYHPGGVEISTLDKEEALKETCELLKKENVTVFEGAFKHEDLFIRADIVERSGNQLFLTEVKAKSYDASEDQFYNKTLLKKGVYKINSDWEPYIIDLAFQYFVVKACFPEFEIYPSLFLANKRSTATVDGLNQQFLLVRDKGGRTSVKTVGNLTLESVGAPVLIKVNLEKEVQLLLTQTYANGKTFEEYVTDLAKVYTQGLKPSAPIGSVCKSCEFRLARTPLNQELKSGFEECWAEALNLSIKEVQRPTVLDIWNFRKSEDLMFHGKYFAAELEQSDFSIKDSDAGLSLSQRQWLQVEKIKQRDLAPFFDKEGFLMEYQKWRYPLHFIDFETTMSAIPFNKGRRPYEQIAFQFSHHILDKSGSVRHEDQYINRIKGHFPNFDFLRNLRSALEKDGGTIFRYAAHENTVLCQIRRQLQTSAEKDREELIEWIEGITTGKEDEYEWRGHRNMVDMCELVKRFYYHPATNGSNSIKKVLPAILQESQFLQDRYSKPIYGSILGISSKNYKNWNWISKEDDGSLIDPYKLLPPIFDDLDLETMDRLITEGSLADGGAAMTAYARMQFTEMSDAECEQVTSALLKYCELDTFAMVMIFEYWKYELGQMEIKAA